MNTSRNGRNKTPTAEQMDLAAAWLDYYEAHGSGSDAEACKIVAEWLREQAVEKELRAAAREHRVPVARLRAKLKEQTRG